MQTEHEHLDTNLSAISHVAPFLQFFLAMLEVAFSQIHLFFGPPDQLARMKRDVLHVEGALGGAQALTFCR